MLLSHHKGGLAQEVILHQRWSLKQMQVENRGVQMALYSVSTVKGVRLDTDNGVVDVRTTFDDCGVLVVRVDKLYRVAIETAETSEVRNA